MTGLKAGLVGKAASEKCSADEDGCDVGQYSPRKFKAASPEKSARKIRILLAAQRT